MSTKNKSVLFAPLLFTQTLPRKRFLRPALLAGFHVETMLLNFLDDVFLLHLALKTTQGIFQRLTLLDNDFSHFINSPPIRLGLVLSLKPGLCRFQPLSLSHGESHGPNTGSSAAA